MALKAGRRGCKVVAVGATLWAVCAGLLPAQSTRRLSDEVTARRAPGLGLPALPVPAGPAATADEVIEQMARAAGVIFAGQVTAVRQPANSAAGSVVEIDLRVDQAVRGPAAGSIYTLREWAGLWHATGGGRYRSGQRLLIFLYAPDARGMSSPVRGLDGAIPLRGIGPAPGPDTAPSASTAAAENGAGEWMVDLRWVQAQALKTSAPSVPPSRGGPVSPRPISPEPISPEPVHPPVASLPLAGGLTPKIETLRNELAIEKLPERWVPIPVPMPQPAAVPPETQPLTQVIALCREAIRGSDGVR